MENTPEQNWTAHIVISCEHAGLRPQFKDLQAEIYHVLARVDNPIDASHYVQSLRAKSIEWLRLYERRHVEK